MPNPSRFLPPISAVQVQVLGCDRVAPIALQETSPEGLLFDSVVAQEPSEIRLHLLLRNTATSDAFLGTRDGLPLATLTAQSGRQRGINAFCGARIFNDGVLRISAGSDVRIYPTFQGIPEGADAVRTHIELDVGFAPDQTSFTIVEPAVFLHVSEAECAAEPS